MGAQAAPAQFAPAGVVIAYCETSVPQYAGGWLFLIIFSSFVLCPCCCFMGMTLCDRVWLEDDGAFQNYIIPTGCCILI